jgi:hypothetical protein
VLDNWDWVDQSNPNTRYWVYFQSDPGIGLDTLWIIPKREARGPQLLGVRLGSQCNPNPDLITQDWIARAIQSLIFQYQVLKKTIQSNKLSNTVSDWIGFIVDPIPTFRNRGLGVPLPDIHILQDHKKLQQQINKKNYHFSTFFPILLSYCI